MSDRLEKMGLVEKTSDRTERTKRITNRVPVSGNRDILTVEGKEEGYVYRWVLDKGNRVLKFKKGGYEIVTHDVTVGDARVGTSSPAGSPVVAETGSNKLYLMRILAEYYKEDQDAKEANLRSLEDSMGAELDGKYGNIRIERK